MPALLGMGSVVPLPVRNKPKFGHAQPAAPAPAGDIVRFSGARQQPSIFDDPYPINFNVPVTIETAAQLNNQLVQIARGKQQQLGGGTVKLFINTPGGEIFSGLQTVEFMKHLPVEVDTIVMGGQAASMGALLFMAGTGRRVMTANSSLLIHQPRIMELGGTMSELEQIAGELKGLHHRLQRLISERSGMPMEKVKEMTDVNMDVRIFPLEALKLGFATHVLLDDGSALTQKSIANMSDEEIKQRDYDGDYSGLQGEYLDPKISGNSGPGPSSRSRGRGPSGFEVSQVELPSQKPDSGLDELDDASMTGFTHQPNNPPNVRPKILLYA